MLKTKSGFTLVELLIVIVVVAILAAITIVGYGAVRDRGRDASIQNDLKHAANAMGIAQTKAGGVYPDTLPSTVSVSKGNVLQLAATKNRSSFCINGYGPKNARWSYDSEAGTVRNYLCGGVTVGSAVGGTVPTAPQNSNLALDFSQWTTSGGMTYNSSTKEMVCTNGVAGNATSPLMRVDQPSTGSFKYEAYATVATPTRPNSGSYVGSKYYAADGSTPAYNTTPSPGPHAGNGSAPALSALSSWQSFNFAMTMGPNIIYSTITVACDTSANRYTSDTRYRNPVFTVQ